jgi:cell division protease FtsH
MIFDDISTGAQNDLERATEIARSMVMDYGMSRLGRVNFRESNRSPFLASSGDGQRTHGHSEQTSREIDEEVKRIIDDSIERVRHILAARRQALAAVSERLLEQEVIDADELQQILEENSSSPMIVPGTDTELKRTGKSAEPAESKGAERAGGG